jgi:hypothetical protein
MNWLRRRRVEKKAPLVPAAAALNAFDTLVVRVGDDGDVELLAGDPEAFGAADAAALLAQLSCDEPQLAPRLDALRRRGEAFACEAGGLRLEGRPAGALALVKIERARAWPGADGARLAAFINARAAPAWIAGLDGVPVWVNQAWLDAVGAASLTEAQGAAATLDAAADRLAREAAASGEARSAVRWIGLAAGRRALRLTITPLAGAGAAVWSEDVTEAMGMAERLQGEAAAQESILDLVADAVAVFGPDRRLSFHNPAFAALWGLQPAWLADRPGHGELLDRLRAGGRLPQSGDWAAFRAAELARHEQVGAAADTVWRLGDERTLKVASRPHPRGGLVMVFSDITPELRLRSQFNHLLQVQQATLDKLSDAVAVFGADGRLRLHNEAFERLWSVTARQLAKGLAFDDMVELATPRLHDLAFWRDLKGRITDPDPAARAPARRELQTADNRAVAHQSLPLPDGATLISFVDITDTRSLERALGDREAALSEAERLKREFVGSVSYELRTPLTTIAGYAEMLERAGAEVDPTLRGYLAAIRAAAAQLARSINDVLDMAQFDAGEVAPEIEEVDVAALMGEIARRWAPAAAEQGVDVALAPTHDLGLMRADPRRLDDILDHLTENALRHTPAGGTITLAAERALGEVRLQVSDTGAGIPFHVQAHIFDRFTGQSGSGLTLALVKALTELHGGWVALESEPGAGATFTCHLPESAEAHEARPQLF